MKIFSEYETKFVVPMMLQQTRYVISKLDFSIPGYNYVAKIHLNKIILSPKSESIIFYNSFVPDLQIELEERSDNTEVHICFKLQNIIRIIILIFIFIGIFIQILTIARSISDRYLSFVILLPLGLIILSIVFANFGLYLSSKSVLKRINQQLVIEQKITLKKRLLY